jgi:hypothetical protein
MAMEKTLRLESTRRFPLFHRHHAGVRFIPPRSAAEGRRRKQQPNGVLENLLVKMGPW